MAYILLDESGDLGFDFSKKKTTKFFLVVFMFTGNLRPIEKCIKAAHKELRKKFKRIHSVLHASKEEPKTRLRMLKQLSGKDFDVMVIYLNKRRVYIKLKDEKAVLYNYITNLLLDRIVVKKLVSTDEPIYLIASKRETNRFLNENFRSYIVKHMKDMHGLDLRIEIKTPAEEKSLQAVDFVSWAIFRKLEFGDDAYYNLIRKKIIEEDSLYP